MNRTKRFIGILGLTTLLAFVLACTTASTPPEGPGDSLVVPPAGEQAVPGALGAPAAAFTVPRAGNVNELVSRSEVIVVGTIESVIEEKVMGPYGEDGQPLPADEGGLPFTDYSVRIEEVLKDDGSISQSDAFILRMFGHRSSAGQAALTSVSFSLPDPGVRLLFALGKNPDGTYGSGPEGLFAIDGAAVSYADGVPFGEDLTPEALKTKIKDMI